MTTKPQFGELIIDGVSYIITFGILSVEEQTYTSIIIGYEWYMVGKPLECSWY